MVRGESVGRCDFDRKVEVRRVLVGFVVGSLVLFGAGGRGLAEGVDHDVSW